LGGAKILHHEQGRKKKKAPGETLALRGGGFTESTHRPWSCHSGIGKKGLKKKQIMAGGGGAGIRTQGEGGHVSFNCPKKKETQRNKNKTPPQPKKTQKKKETNQQPPKKPKKKKKNHPKTQNKNLQNPQKKQKKKQPTTCNPNPRKKPPTPQGQNKTPNQTPKKKKKKKKQKKELLLGEV